MFRTMTPDQLKQYWVDKWSADGLDPDVLSAVWDNVKPVIDILGSARTTARMRFIREKLYRTG